MTTSDTTKAMNGLQGDWAQTVRRHLCNRWALLGAAGAILVAGMALNWGWLVALGVAPALLSLLPCLIMCGLGLCGMKMMADSGAKQPSQSNDAAQAEGSSSPLGISSCCHTDADKVEPSQAKDLQRKN